jgi:hypothetical protein
MPPRTVADVADVAELPASRGEVSRRHKCIHCGKYGETVQIGYGNATANLHRECIKAWQEDYDDRNGSAV